MIGRTVSHYRITGEIGAGGMGVVYRAHDEALDREIAVKVLPAQFAADPQRRARFEREARAAARLSHPGIVQVYDFGVAEGMAFAVSELVEGCNLREHLGGHGLPWREAVAGAMQIAAALAAAHEKGIVHRDLKPENVMVDPSGRLKVLDFGLARIMEPGEVSATQATVSDSLTGAGTILGTVGYMAPEQLRGQDVDARADVFAFGCLFYEMLSGRRAFVGESQADTISAILNADPPPVASAVTGLPTALDLVIRRCLQKRREDRFASAHDVQVALETASSDLGAPAPLASAPRGRRRAGGRHTRSLAGLAVLAVLAAIAVAFLAGRSGRAPTSATDPAATTAATPPPVAEAEQNSIAVLPFADLSAAGDQEYFADGMTEELLNTLAKLPELRVASRTSSFSFKGRSVPVDSIARALHVAHVLEGSIRKDGDRIRITAQLIDAAKGYHIWSETYDREIGGVFALQDEIAHAIVSALQLKLGGGRAVAALAKEETADPEAHALLLRAQQRLRLGGSPDIDEAVALLQQAVTRDPQYARAHAGLASAYAEQAYRRARPRKEIEAEARAEAERALALDPELPEAHEALADIASEFDLDLKATETHMRRALELNPGLSTVHSRYGWLLSQFGRVDEAIAEAKRAVDLDPLSPGMYSNLGAIYFYAQQYDHAFAAIEASLALDAPPVTLVNLAIAYATLGRFDEALGACNRALRDAPDNQFAIGILAYVHALAGHRDEAERLLSELEVMPEPSPYLLATIHEALGNRAAALSLLERAVAEKDPSVADLAVDPAFEKAQDEPRVQALLVKMGLR